MINAKDTDHLSISVPISLPQLYQLPHNAPLTTMPLEKPAVVVVPGAWTQPVAYQKLVSILEAQSFEVHVPALPTNNGRRPPDSSPEADTTAVRQVLERLVCEEGKCVIVLMHSYGGVPGSNAITGLSRKARQSSALPGGVIHLIYIASFMLAAGQTAREVVRKGNLPGRSSLLKFEQDGTWFPADPAWLLYHDLSTSDQTEQVNLLKYGNLSIMSNEATYEAWRDCPTTYVRATLDRWLVPEFQDICLANASDAGVTIDIIALRSGHSPYVNFAQELAALVAKVSST
ncbi:Alpha/beta hydrolase fold-1 [Annulohypoxylon stygium]|nr:Alpha/beta hydrolase fold-1 [Annulohypoxylon stygium]